MTVTIKDIRAKYPQYSNRTDRELADALHYRFYADKMEVEDFYGKIGFDPATEKPAPPLPTKDEPGWLASPAPLAQPQMPVPVPLVKPDAATVPAQVARPDPLIGALMPDAAPVRGTAPIPAAPPQPRADDDPYPASGMMGATTEEQQRWLLREIARRDAAAGIDPLVRALAPPPIQIAPMQPVTGFQPTPPVYDPLLKALGAELGNVPERFRRGLAGNALASAEMRQVGSQETIRRAKELADPSDELAEIDKKMKRLGEKMLAPMLRDPEETSQSVVAEITALREQRAMIEAAPERTSAVIVSARNRFRGAQGDRAAAQGRIAAAEATMTPTNPRPGLQEAIVSGVASLGDMAPGLAATLVTKNPLPMLAYMTGYSRGSTYADKRGEGVESAKASTAANLYAVAEAIPEMVPIAVLLKQGLNPFAKIAGVALTEGASEVVTSGLQTLIDMGVLNESMTWGEAIAEAEKAGAAGMVMGALTGGAGVAVDKAEDRIRDSRAAKGTPADPNAVPPPGPKPVAPPVDALAAAMAPPAPPQAVQTAPPVPQVTEAPRPVTEAPAAPAVPVPQDAPSAPAAAASSAASRVSVQIEGQEPFVGQIVRRRAGAMTVQEDDGTETEIADDDITEGRITVGPVDAAASKAAPEPKAEPVEDPDAPGTITETEALANPERYEVIEEVEGTGPETRPTGERVVIDNETGRVLRIAPPKAAGGVGPAGGGQPQAERVPGDVGTGPGATPAAGDEPTVQKRTEREPVKKPDAEQRAPVRKFLTHDETLAIQTDAKAFQYKGNGDTEGVTDVLRNTSRYDPNRAGQVVLWERKDGTQFVADGHQRTGLARRSAEARQKDVGGTAAVIYREADGFTADEVMNRAALKNIGEGSGTAVDAARVLQKNGGSVADLGLPPNSALVRTADGLRRLSPDAFGMVANGKASERDGDAVGRNVQDKGLQSDILALLTREKPENALQAAMMARDAASNATTETQTDMFGTVEAKKSLYRERAQVLDGALKALGSKLRTFRNAVDNAQALEGAGNKLDAKANAAEVDDAARIRQYLTAQANMKGPISDALTEAARAVADGQPVAGQARAFVRAVQRAVEGGGPGREGAAAGGGRDEAARTPEPAPQLKPPADDLLAALSPAATQAPKPKSPQDDLLSAMMPAQTGKTPDQVRAEAEAKVKAQQSKLRKPGGNSGDAGPLFNPQDDLLDQKPNAVEKAPPKRLGPKAQGAARAAAIADYFTPGNIVRSYGGGADRVISFTPGQNGDWTVDVQAVRKVGEEWVADKNERIRNHRTTPTDRELKAGPLERAPTDDHPLDPSIRHQRQTAAHATAAADEIARLMPALRAELDRLDLKRVTLTQATGEGWQGAFQVTGDGAMEIVIGASLDPLKTLHHEVIHALRAMNLFTPMEWAALEVEASRAWVEKHNIAARYPELLPNEQIEEAIAEEFAAAVKAKAAPSGSVLIRAFNKITRILKAIRSVFNGAGFNTPEDIFGKVLAGEIVGRQSVEPENQGSKYQRKPSSFSPTGLDRIRTANATYGPPQGPIQLPLPSTFPAPPRRHALGLFGVQTMGSISEEFQDRFSMLTSINAAIEAHTGEPIPEEINARTRQTVYDGRTSSRLERMLKDEVRPLTDAMRRAKVTLDDLGTYLLAKHAPERNALMQKRDPERFHQGNGSGLYDEAATDLLREFDERGLTAKLEKLGTMVREMLDRDLAGRRAAGLISEAEFKSFKSMFKHYTPLRGHVERDDGGQMGRLGKGFDIRGREVKQALGRMSISENPLVQAISMRQEGIVRTEKARVNRALLHQVERYPNPDLWEVLGKLPTRKVYDKDTGMVRTMVDFGALREDEILGVKVGGETKYVRIKDRFLAEAFKNIGITPPGDWAVLFNGLFRLTRAFSTMNTGANPNFVFPNAQSDFLEGVWTAFNADKKKMVRGFTKNYPLALAAAMQREIRDSAAGRGLSAIPIQRLKRMVGRDIDNAELGRVERYIDEWELAGGRISFMGFRDLEEITGDIDTAMKGDGWRKWATRPWTVVGDMVSVIEKINAPVENATRLAMYVTAREVGYSKDVSAAMSLDSSGNYYAKGRQTRKFSTLYAFFNPAVQGLEKFIRFSKTPRNWAIMGGLVGTGFALTAINLLRFEDDDDPEGRSLYWQIPEFERNRSLIIPIGIEEDIPATGADTDGMSFEISARERKSAKRLKYLSFRVPHNLRPFLAMGNELAMVMFGGSDPADAASNAGRSLLAGSNPFGSENLWNAAAPTILDPVVDTGFNRNWTGTPIHPQPERWNEGLPHSNQYFPRSTSPVAIWVAQTANNLTGGDRFRPGLADAYPGDLQHMFDFWTGGLGRFIRMSGEAVADKVAGIETDPGRVPVMRSVLGRTNAYAISDRYYEHRDRATADENRARAIQKALLKSPRDKELVAEWKRASGLLNLSISNNGEISWKQSPVKIIKAADEAIKKLREEQFVVTSNDNLTRARRVQRERQILRAIEEIQREAIRLYLDQMARNEASSGPP